MLVAQSRLEAPASGAAVVEVGPRMSFSTAWSANAVSICHSCGLTKVTRMEQSRRYLLKSSSPLSQKQLLKFAGMVSYPRATWPQPGGSCCTVAVEMFCVLLTDVDMRSWPGTGRQCLGLTLVRECQQLVWLRGFADIPACVKGAGHRMDQALLLRRPS